MQEITALMEESSGSCKPSPRASSRFTPSGSDSVSLVRFAVGGERRGLYPPILAAVLLRLRGDAGRSHEAPLSPPLSTAGSPVFQASAAPGENFIPRPQSRRVPPPLGGTCPNEERWKEARRRPVKQAIKLCSLDPLSYRVRSFGIRLKDKANFLHHTTISSFHNDRS